MSGKKVLISLIFSLGAIFLLPNMISTVNAERSESELQSERSEIQSEIEEKREELAEIQEELVELEDEIDVINEVIKANEEEILKTEKDIEEKEADIAILEEEIEQLEIDIERRSDILKDRAVSLQRNGGSVSYADVLFGAQSFTDFIDRVSLVTKIAQSDQSLIENLQADKEKVAEQKQIVADKLVALEDAITELEHIHELILVQKEDLEEMQTDLEEKQEKSEAIIKELELEDLEIERMITAARRRAEQERAAARIAAQQNSIAQFSSNSNSNNSTSSSSNNNNPVGTPTHTGSGSLSTVINAGSHWNGGGNTHYGYGRRDPQHGVFDCSGFVSWAFGQAGVNVSRSTDGLASTGQRVSTSDMRPGDIVFFDTYKTNGHVGIYLGNGQFRGSQSSTGVAIASMNSGYWSARFNGHVRRIMN